MVFDLDALVRETFNGPVRIPPKEDPTQCVTFVTDEIRLNWGSIAPIPSKMAKRLKLKESGYLWPPLDVVYHYTFDIMDMRVRPFIKYVTKVEWEKYAPIVAGVIVEMDKIECDKASRKLVIEYLESARKLTSRLPRYNLEGSYFFAKKVNLSGNSPENSRLTVDYLERFSLELGVIKALEENVSIYEKARRIRESIIYLWYKRAKLTPPQKPLFFRGHKFHNARIIERKLKESSQCTEEKKDLWKEMGNIFSNEILPHARRVEGEIKRVIGENLDQILGY